MVGSPATDLDFFDREREIGDFIERLDAGTHILITAPRRIGKTSLLMEAARRLQDRYYCLYVDLEACLTEADAIVKLAVEAKKLRGLAHVVLDTFRNTLSAIMDRINEVSISEITLKLNEGIDKDWRAKGDELLERMAGADRSVIILFDELPVLVNALLKGPDLLISQEGIQRARLFLSWLREATIRHQGKLRFVACGSIGLEPLLNQAGISEVMTTFSPFELEPWDDKTARAFLDDRAARHSIQFREDAQGRILKLLGYNIPQHVQMFMHFVCDDSHRRETAECLPDDIDRLYKEKMLGIRGHLDLTTYEDRLKRVVHPKLLAASLEMLTEAAVSRKLTPQAAVTIVRSYVNEGADPIAELRHLLGILEHDGYLKRSGNNYVFVSHLLRDWWKRRFSHEYVPVNKRQAGGQA